MGIRRKGREVALQTLYALAFAKQETQPSETDEPIDHHTILMEVILDMNIKEDSKIITFAEELLALLIPRLTEVDENIRINSANWTFDNIAEVDKSILRIAVAEILYTDTPAAIIMNEAIEISKKFSSESSGKFINGILNAVADGKK